MFSTITWEAFLITVTLIVSGYYVITALLLYHKEIIQRFNRKPDQVSDECLPDRAASAPDIMGIKSELESAPRTSSVPAEEVGVSTADNDSGEPEAITVLRQTSGDESRLLIGSVADLLQEVGIIFRLAGESRSPKAECEALLRTLLLRYPHVRKTAYRKTVTDYICQAGGKHLTFVPEPQEVERWWDEEQAHNIQH